MEMKNNWSKKARDQSRCQLIFSGRTKMVATCCT